MIIIFHLFAKGVLRFSMLGRVIPGVTQKVLIQQLRELERDGVVARTVYHEVQPKVEYGLTDLGKELSPALDELLIWAHRRKLPEAALSTTRLVNVPVFLIDSSNRQQHFRMSCLKTPENNRTLS